MNGWPRPPACSPANIKSPCTVKATTFSPIRASRNWWTTECPRDGPGATTAIAPPTKARVGSSASGTGIAHSGDRAVTCESTEGEADTSLYADVALEPNTSYRLSGWVRGRGLRGKLSFNDHINRYETERVTRDGEWTEVEAVFNSGTATRGSINILFVARGQGWFDDVRLSKLLPPKPLKSRSPPAIPSAAKPSSSNTPPPASIAIRSADKAARSAWCSTASRRVNRPIHQGKPGHTQQGNGQGLRRLVDVPHAAHGRHLHTAGTRGYPGLRRHAALIRQAEGPSRCLP